MSTCLINPCRGAGEPLLPAQGILAVNPADSTGFPELARRFALDRHGLFHAQLLAGSALFVAGPAVGAPMATICLEKLIALGARRILLYGWCGSLVPELRTGMLFVPTDGLSEEGTSGHYPGPAADCGRTLRPPLIRALSTLALPYAQGAIWTTDAVYRETGDKVEQYRARGIMAVDMEYTALRAVAAFRGADLAALMLVSDQLTNPAWRPGFADRAFRRRSRRLLTQLCALMEAGTL